MKQNGSIIIVGAGLCGLALAYQLRSAGERQVTLLDKSRGVGGRMATRRTETARFDHGAQFYSLKPPIEALHRRWEAAGLVRPCNADHSSFVAIAGMTSLAKNLAEGLDVRLSEKVIHLQRVHDEWSLKLESGGELRGETVVLTCPVPQTLDLLRQSAIPFDPALERIHYAKALVGLFENVRSSSTERFTAGPFWDPGTDVFRIANQRVKGLCEREAWTVTMSDAFAEKHFGEDPEKVMSLIEAQLRELDTAIQFGESQLKSWRYSQPFSRWEGPNKFVAMGEGLYLAGDGFGGASLNGAAASAAAVSEALAP